MSKDLVNAILNERSKTMTKKIIKLERQLRSKSENDRYDAACELGELGIEAVPILLKALQDDRKEVSDDATTGIIVLMNESEDVDKEKLREALKPATKFLINMVEGAKISSGVRSFDKYIYGAMNALECIGDPIAIPALEKILAKVQDKIEREGVVYKYAETESIAGYISTEDEVSHIKSTIENIRKKG